MDELSLPLRPTRPLDSDCCGNGCVPCVFDIYDEEMRIWEKECSRIVSGEIDGTKSDGEDDSIEVSLNLDEYGRYQIMSVTSETKDAFRFRIKLLKGKSLGLQVGQHIIIRGYLKEVPVTRQFTPVTDVDVKGHFDLVIKIYPDGAMSQIIKTWKAGTFIDIRGPFGNFVYKRNKYDKLYLLAAGTGIAPMAQIIQHILGDEEDETMLRLVYASRTYQDILLKTELNSWSSFWNLSVVYALSQDTTDPSSYRYKDEVVHGRVTESILQTQIKPKQENILFIVCGTKSFESDMIKYLQALGFTDQYYRF